MRGSFGLVRLPCVGGPVLEVEAASFVAQHVLGLEELDEAPQRESRPVTGGSFGVFRRGHKPGVGENLHGIRGPKWWRKAVVTVRVSAWLTRRVYGVCRFTVRHPVLVLDGVLAVAWVGALLWFGPAAVLISTWMAAGVACLAAGMWAEYDERSFRRCVVVPLRSFWRRTTVYRRHWRPATAGARLARIKESYQDFPRLGRVRSGRHFDSVRVKLVDGYTVHDWTKMGEALASSFSVEAVRAYPVDRRPKWIELRCRVNDPLRAVVSPSPVADEVDLSAVVIGKREDGKALTLPANRHLLIAGESGAGKSSAIWALVRGVAPLIAAGTLRIVAVDPKSVELSAGAPLWHAHCQTGRAVDAARFLEHVVKLMEERKDRLQGQSRKLTEFTVEEPAYAVIVDELAALSAWVNDPKLKARLANAMGLIQSQGRALGFWLWGASQLVQKEVLGASTRDLSQVRVLFRVADADQVDMALGRGSRARGALADQIDARMPGTCFLVEDGDPNPVRGRVAYVTDADIARIAKAHGRKLHAVPDAA